MALPTYLKLSTRQLIENKLFIYSVIFFSKIDREGWVDRERFYRIVLHIERHFPYLFKIPANIALPSVAPRAKSEALSG